jgi:uncharacterized ferritin-like protein (DUF455 family)
MTSSVFQAAYIALMASDVMKKVELTQQLKDDWFSGLLSTEEVVATLSRLVPGRPLRPKLVAPRLLKARKLHTFEGKVAFIHALAHIEFNAINLALDAVYRFRDMPSEYYGDWLNVAVEEARHFGLLSARLVSLGHRYGDYPAHGSLWEMAIKTETGVLERMAMVPRVYEARGLDVTPGMIEKLQRLGDFQSADILAVILREEIGHVATGNRWYLWACKKEDIDPQCTFSSLIKRYRPGPVKGPFNYAARIQAGFSEEELEKLERS